MKTTDSQSGYRAYSRRAIEEIKIRNPNMGAGSEILTRVRDCNLNVVEIPINMRYDTFGTSSKNPVSHGFLGTGMFDQHHFPRRDCCYSLGLFGAF